jgi:cation diffusion facilitator family transporter
MNPVASKATILNIIGNAILFAIKIIAGMASGSIALVSDALNSFNDVAASIAIFISVKISDSAADEGHPFGHSRAEPIAGLVVAILAGILGFELIRNSCERLLSKAPALEISPLVIAVPIVTIALKSVMAWHFKRVAVEVKSPAIMASSIDSLFDVAVSGAALIGLIGAHFGHMWLDPAAGLAISLWVIYAGYRIAVENIDYLMGKAPPKELMERIRSSALSVEGVRAVNAARAHYVGNFIHVEIHVAVDKNMTTADSHAIGDRVEDEIEKTGAIDKAFVHIDPV